MPALEMAVAEDFHLLAAPKELDGRYFDLLCNNNKYKGDTNNKDASLIQKITRCPFAT